MNWPLLKLAQRPLIAHMLGERGYASLASLRRTLAFSWHSLLGHPHFLFLIRLQSDPVVSVIGIALSPLGAMAEPLGSKAPGALSVAGVGLLEHSLQQSFCDTF